MYMHLYEGGGCGDAVSVGMLGGVRVRVSG